MNMTGGFDGGNGVAMFPLQNVLKAAPPQPQYSTGMEGP